MTEQKVKDILAKQLGVAIEKINANTDIAADLGADSLDLVEVLMSLEEEFSVSIPDEAIPEIKTIKDVVAFIENNKK